MSATAAPMTVEIRVELKAGILDAEAESVQKSLGLLGIGPVAAVRTAKVYVLELPGADRERAEALARDAVDRLLANPVIHRVHVTLRAA
ncbi:MAG: phosphoribosylformylglycinamidine synthase subunit PurS [Thermoplasmata archaeon]|nr:phosphoribosylformylglycinamidine synthase subunit PurS [Thermoplasmata archaeon]